jgi:CBS domain-containing membrane protein
MPDPATRTSTFLLAGASWRARALACAGAVFGVAATVFLMRLGVGHPALPLVAAPLGASAVLVFAVPASPLAQPWPVVGGNSLSALVGLAAARAGLEPSLAAGVAVGGAILVMTLARCLHPPGGAVALLVVTSPQASGAGLAFALQPVALNAVLLVAAGWLFHRLSGHAYPHRVSAAQAEQALAREGLIADDVAAALDDLGESFDIAPEDLELLLARAEHHAALRRTA